MLKGEMSWTFTNVQNTLLSWNIFFLIQMPLFTFMHLNFRVLVANTHKEIHSLDESMLREFFLMSTFSDQEMQVLQDIKQIQDFSKEPTHYRKLLKSTGTFEGKDSNHCTDGCPFCCKPASIHRAWPGTSAARQRPNCSLQNNTIRQWKSERPVYCGEKAVNESLAPPQQVSLHKDGDRTPCQKTGLSKLSVWVKTLSDLN